MTHFLGFMYMYGHSPNSIAENQLSSQRSCFAYHLFVNEGHYLVGKVIKCEGETEEGGGREC